MSLDQARAALSAWDDPCSHDVVEETNTGGRTWHSCRLAADHDGLHHWQPPALAEHLRAALAGMDELILVMALNVLTACAAAQCDPLHPGLVAARSLAHALDKGGHWDRVPVELRAEIERLRAAAGPQMTAFA